MTRPPIVVVLGHVDHGKSSLLEAIREDFKITSKESGGITQHIGAYQVEHQGKQIIFIDTPGHEAFSAMRSRGARVADIAVLVVAADQGVQQQTREAILVIQEAGIPMIVALNKIDKPGADEEKVKRELSQNNVFVESLGGSVPCVNTSATAKQGIGELLEMILLVADLAQLISDPRKSAQGMVIETSLDSKRGNSATLLVKDGTLRAGDIVGTRSAWGKAKILQNFEGASVQETSCTPVVMVGFEEHPHIGEEFQVFDSEDSARAFLSSKVKKESTEVSSLSGRNFLNIVLKADVAGSLEALEGMLSVLPQEKIVLRIVNSGVGDIGEGDVRLAQGTNARVLGFRTKVNASAKEFAERESIPLETFDVIYDLIQRVREVMEKSQESQLIRKDIGSLRVLAVFLREKDRQIIGGRVVDGEVTKGVSVEVVRNGEIAGQGRALNVQKNKKDVDKALKSEECGLLFVGSIQAEAGDILQFHILAPNTI
ncbi:MAG: translation initiation factor IF-2 [Parcubacteria group bacterium Greene0714_21]|nr:MAG: translation initiation factor IF-2 [Parcubacteria group bacterium Greene0416_39]TSC98181.1 MAG: translation initiation factor IF-2 [Parcubacteria group bacterium Greene1014_47]TSD04051.1 MAG: translation initiation factor IF-2 [Parcubacteria group bacterium Greene0714_21]